MVGTPPRRKRGRLTPLGAATLFLVLVVALRLRAAGPFTPIDGLVIAAGVVAVLATGAWTWKNR